MSKWMMSRLFKRKDRLAEVILKSWDIREGKRILGMKLSKGEMSTQDADYFYSDMRDKLYSKGYWDVQDK